MPGVDLGSKRGKKDGPEFSQASSHLLTGMTRDASLSVATDTGTPDLPPFKVRGLNCYPRPLLAPSAIRSKIRNALSILYPYSTLGFLIPDNLVR